MKKVAIWVMWILAIIWWISVSTTIQKWWFASSAEENVNEKVLDQIDQIFEQDRFMNKQFCEKALVKVAKAIDLTEEWTNKNLLFRYIEAKLKYQIKKVDRIVKTAPKSKVTVVETTEKRIVKKEWTHSAAPEDMRKIEQYRVTPPSSEKMAKEIIQEEVIQEEEKIEKKWFFHLPDYAEEEVTWNSNSMRRIAPLVEKREKKSYGTPEFKYEIDGLLHNEKCEQLQCYNYCRNMDSNYVEEWDKKKEISVDQTCRQTCVSLECKKVFQRTKDKSRYLVEFKEEE